MASRWMSIGLLRKTAAPTFPRRKLLLNNHHAVCRPATLLSRSFNTDSQNDNNCSVNVDVDISGRSDTSLSRPTDSSPPLFSDVVDPFSPARSLSQVLNWVDRLMDDPFSVMAPRIKGGGPRRAWDAKEDETALYLRMDMPGLSKDDVKVTVEQNTLIVKGEESSAQDQEEQDKEDSIPEGGM